MFKKFLIAACLAVSLSLSSLAVFPQEINYQGKLTDSGGVPLTGSYSILFTIWSAPSGGNNIWSETQSVSVEAGFFNVLLGSVTPITTEAFNGSNRWLGIKVGADPEMTPRHKLVSVGHVFHAYNADKLDGHDWSEVPSVDNVVLLGPPSTQSTNAAIAVNVESTDSTGTAVVGIASATGNVYNKGGIFEASGDQGRAVEGYAWATGSYANYGGSFQANGVSGYGVFGDATGSSGKGVGGRSSGANGYGVYGVHTGTGYSGYFTGGKGVKIEGSLEADTAEPTGAAIIGVASATGNVYNKGGIFEANGNQGRAVEGYAWATGSYANYGGSFQADGDLGYGVFGDATGSDGKGVAGRSSGANGYGIYGVHTSTGYSGYFTGGKGVKVVGTIESSAGGIKFPDGTLQTTAATGGATGNFVELGPTSVQSTTAAYAIRVASSNSSGRAVYGHATATGAITNYGGYFEAEGDQGRAVWADAKATGATQNYGGLFIARGNSGRAVYGLADAASGTNYGGFFQALGSSGQAVYGHATATGAVTNYGGYFVAEGPSGHGVHGSATGASSYAVYGENTSTGYSGYFTGGSGVRIEGSLEVSSMADYVADPNVYWDAGTQRFGIAAGFPSSKRYKENIKPLVAGFNQILQIEPKTFTYKDSGKQDIGFIAEDFDDLGLKELVKYDEKGRPDSLKYDRVSLYLLEVIKQQQKRIEALEAKVGK